MSLFTSFFKHQEPTKKEAPALNEIAWHSNTFFSVKGGKFEAFNPDELVARKGADIYRKMLRDPQVKAAFYLLLDMIVSRQFRFEKFSDDPLQEEISEFFLHNINVTLHGTWIQALKNVLMAKATGYSVNEKVFDVTQFNGRDRWVISAIKPKPFETFIFEQDNFGRVKNLIQEQVASRKNLDPRKFIIYQANPELDSIFGESDLRAAYRAYWEKDNIQKFWNIYLERIAGGFVVANPQENAPNLNPTEKRDFENILQNITQATAIRAPQGYNIEVVNGVNTDAFERAVKHRDLQIAKALLTPNQLGFSEDTGAGSQAKARQQFDTFFMVVKEQGELLADAMNEQLFKELAWWNFGTLDCPRFTFEEFTNDQKIAIAEAWTDAVQKGSVINTFNDELRTRELLQYESREEDTEGLKPTNDNPDTDQNADGNDEIQAGEIPEETLDLKDAEFTHTDDILFDPSNAGISPEETHMARVNVAELKVIFQENEETFFEKLSVVVDKAFDEVLEMFVVIGKRLERKDDPDFDMEKALIDLNNSITPGTKIEMNQTIKRFLRDAYDDGRLVAQEEINKALDQVPDPQMSEKIKANIVFSKKTAVRPRTENHEDYVWSVKHFVDGLDLDTAEKYFTAKAFWITGDITDEMIEKAKLVILNGIRDEMSVDQMVDELQAVLQLLIGKIDPSTGEPNKFDRPRLNTIIRTNITDAFNQAQLAVFTDPELGDFVQALEYSALIDTRTTQFCNTYHGRKFLLNDPIWGSITPPNHFNCRSRTIALTVLDEFKLSQPATGVVPDSGFGSSIQFLT